jgi:hypothetical protein
MAVEVVVDWGALTTLSTEKYNKYYDIVHN